MMDYKIIVLDLDGTLTNRNKVITPKTKDALMRIQAMGKKVVLASGRPTYGVMPLAKELKLGEYGGYILSFNGGMIVDCRTEETVFESRLPVEANKKILGLSVEEGVNILTYDKDMIITPDATDQYAVMESQVNGLPLKQVKDMEAYLDFAVPKFIMLDDGDFLALVEPRVKAALGKNFSVYRSEPYFLEIMPKGIDKAKSLARFLEISGFSREEMIACGDGYNDLSMIRYAGLGVAMENAVLPVRNAADFITYSNNEDGIAHVVEKFMVS